MIKIIANRDTALHKIREAARDKLLSDLSAVIDESRSEVGYALTAVDVIGCIECIKLHYYNSMYLQELEDNS